MFKKHEKLFYILAVVLFMIAVVSLLSYHRSSDHRPGISLSGLPAPSGNSSITDGHININTADSEVLQLLPGIGEKLSERIIQHRTTYGPFLSTRDLMQVHGIGENIYNKIVPYITTGGNP
jgi:competence ComEA-like helix-hairpin-helix protein